MTPLTQELAEFIIKTLVREAAGPVPFLTVKDSSPADTVMFSVLAICGIFGLEKVQTKAGVKVIEPRAKEKGKLAGKTFVFTGALKTFARDQARTLVESLGGMTASTVSKKVDFVVVGEDPGSKFDKAKELGIKTLTEEEFKKMVG